MGSSNSKKKGDSSSKDEDNIDVPSPEEIAGSQRKGSTEGKQTIGKSDSDGSNNIKDEDDTLYPPSSTKSESFKSEDFKDIDKHAIKAKLSLADQGYDRLVAFLVKPAQDDIYKVRALFTWLTSQERDTVLDHYVKAQTKSQKKESQQSSPLPSLYEFFVKKNPDPLAQAFHDLCREANVESKIIDTNARSVSFPDFEFPVITETLTNVVRIEGQWRFVDVIRAMGVTFDVIDNEDDDEFKPVPKEIREYWFLPDPEQMIFYQYPDFPENQLLFSPVTDQQFARMALVTPSFFNIGIKRISHPKYYVNTEEGKVCFELEMNEGSNSKFEYDLSKSIHDPARNFFDGRDLNDYVSSEQAASKIKFSIELPWIGKFKFDIKRSGVQGDASGKIIMTYFIICDKPCFYAEPSPFPGIAYGIAPEAAELGIESVQTYPGRVEVPEGHAIFTFNFTESFERFAHHLQCEEGTPEENESCSKQCVRHFVHDEDRVSFIVKVRKRGNYLLSVFAVPQNGSYTIIAHYLLDVQRGCSHFSGHDFPPCGDSEIDGCIGDLRYNGQHIAKPKSHSNPIIVCPGSGDLKIGMKPAEDDTSSLEYLLKFHGTDCIEDLSFHVLQYRKPDKTMKFYFMFPKAGIYTFELFDGDPENNAACIYQYIITVASPMKKCCPPPKFCHWEDGINLLEPTSGYLQTHSKYLAKFRVPRATAVNIEGTTHLKKKKDDLWIGEFETGENSSQLSVFATFKGYENATELFQYTVFDDSEMKEYEEKQQAAQEESLRQQMELENIRAKEDEEIMVQQKERERKLSNRKKEFYSKQKEHETQEQKLQKEENEKAQEQQICLSDKRRSKKSAYKVEIPEDDKVHDEAIPDAPAYKSPTKEPETLPPVENTAKNDTVNKPPEAKKAKVPQAKNQTITVQKSKKEEPKANKDRKRKPNSETPKAHVVMPEKGKSEKSTKSKIPIKNEKSSSRKVSPNPKRKPRNTENIIVTTTEEENGDTHTEPIENSTNINKMESPSKDNNDKENDDADSDEDAILSSRNDDHSVDSELEREVTIELAQVIKRRKKAFDYQHPQLLNEGDEWLAVGILRVSEGSVDPKGTKLDGAGVANV